MVLYPQEVLFDRVRYPLDTRICAAVTDPNQRIFRDKRANPRQVVRAIRLLVLFHELCGRHLFLRATALRSAATRQSDYFFALQTKSTPLPAGSTRFARPPFAPH